MRVPFKYKLKLLKIGKRQLNFEFAKKFKSKDNLISLGSNCHAAYLLESLNFRKQSLPFDWLLTDSLMGLSYVTENIKNNFKDFTSDLKLNDENKAYASKFPYSCFFHHSAIMTDEGLMKTVRKRINTFLEIFKNKQCNFLYVLSGSTINSRSAADNFKTSVLEFIDLMKKEDKLFIYINFEENLNDNKEFCDQLINDLKEKKSLKISKFLLEVGKYGMWGYQNNYSNLVRELGINISPSFPQLKFSLIKT